MEPQAEAPGPGVPRSEATRRGSNSAGLPTAGAAAGPASEGGPRVSSMSAAGIRSP